MSLDTLPPFILKDYGDFGEPGIALQKKIRDAFLGLRSETVTPTSIPWDDKYYSVKKDQQGLQAIESSHFDTLPVHVEKDVEEYPDPFIWLQTLVDQKGAVVQTNQGETKISGFIISFLTPQNEVLMIADNEPGAPKEVNAANEETHPLLRHPFQTGIPKYRDILQGNEIKKDPALKKIVDSGVLTQDRLQSPWTISLHDPTRMKGVNLVKTERLTQEEVEKLAEVLPLLKFTLDEIFILAEVGKYLPPHTLHTAIVSTLLKIANTR